LNSSLEPESRQPSFVERQRALALSELARMYEPAAGLFLFRLRRDAAGLVREGLSPRYTAIAAIGLAGEPPEAARGVLGHDLAALGDRLLQDAGGAANLGDLALTLWAGVLLRSRRLDAALQRLAALQPEHGPRYTVELAWALAALSLHDAPGVRDLRERVARRLLDGFAQHSGLFPHRIGGAGGLRGHVACFADLVYPIQALSYYARVSGDRRALEAASRCAERICRLQGPAGQWWWHYDVRSGRVLEPYPVYAVHQNAMAPMALFALREAGGPDLGEHERRGLDWLARSPELAGGSLVDAEAGVIWRKVARREPGKLSRTLQALASRAGRGVRVPALDRLFPPGRVDHETRPYQAGWLLYAYPRERGSRW
jgi:hypothetical protein